MDKRVVTLLAGLVALSVLCGFPHISFAQDLRTDDRPEDEDQGPPVATGAAPRTKGALLKEPRFFTTAIDSGFERVSDSAISGSGFYLELSNMITGSGWVSIGPGYRHEIFEKNGFVDVSAAVSWRLYNMMQGRIEFPDLLNRHLTLGSQAMWQDQKQINYFGIGSATDEENQTQYRMQSVDSVAYALIKPGASLTLGGEYGFLRRPTILNADGPFLQELPTLRQAFPNDPGVPDGFQPNYLHGEVSLTSDTRNHRSRPTRGGLYRIAWMDYVDQSTSIGAFTFRQYEAEAAQFIPAKGERWVFALHGWVMSSDVPHGHEIPFYLLPTLGGNNTLRSFSDYRFHDRSLGVLNAESRWLIFTHADLAVFVDAGNVAPRVQDLNLDKTSYGAGLRFHTEKATFARIDIAHGAEGWRAVFRTNDPFRLSRLTRRVAGAPFVP